MPTTVSNLFIPSLLACWMGQFLPWSILPIRHVSKALTVLYYQVLKQLCLLQFFFAIKTALVAKYFWIWYLRNEKCDKLIYPLKKVSFFHEKSCFWWLFNFAFNFQETTPIYLLNYNLNYDVFKLCNKLFKKLFTLNFCRVKLVVINCNY